MTYAEAGRGAGLVVVAMVRRLVAKELKEESFPLDFITKYNKKAFRKIVRRQNVEIEET